MPMDYSLCNKNKNKNNNDNVIMLINNNNNDNNCIMLWDQGEGKLI